MPSRRSLLAAVGATATAGCLDQLPGRGTHGFRLGPFWVQNGSGEPRTLAVVLKRNGETVVDDAFDLAAEGGEGRVKLDPTWSVAPASYVLSYGYPDAELATYALTGEDDTTGDEGCMFLQLDIHPAGDIPAHSVAPASEHPWNPPCPET